MTILEKDFTPEKYEAAMKRVIKEESAADEKSFGIQVGIEYIVGAFDGSLQPIGDKGGPGSGNFGHSGRPGEIGGSGDGGTSISANEASGLLNVLREKNGFSYQPILDKSPVDGYMVSPYEDRTKIFENIKDASRTELRAYAKANTDLLVDTDKYAGGWLDPDTGKVFFDISIRVETHEEAHKLCEHHKQRGYYGVKEDKYYKVLSEEEAHKRLTLGLSLANWYLTQNAKTHTHAIQRPG